MFGGVRVLGQERNQRHQKTGGAEPALQAVFLAEGELDRVQVLVSACHIPVGRQAFDRGQLVAVHLHREQQARAHCLAVQQNRARAARTLFTADMGAGQSQIVAQEVAQQQSRLNRALVGRAVDGDVDGVGHGA